MKGFYRAAVLLIAAAMLVTAAYAAGGSIGLAADKTELRPGDTVTVTVSLDGNPGIGFLAVFIDFDSSVFTLESRTVGDLLEDNTEVPEVNGRTGFDLGDDLCTENVTADGEVGRIVLKVRDDAANGETAIRATVDDAMTWDLEDVAISDGSLTLTVAGGADATPVPENDGAAEETAEPAAPAPVEAEQEKGEGPAADETEDKPEAAKSEDGAANTPEQGEERSAADDEKVPAAAASQGNGYSALWIGIGAVMILALAVIIVLLLKRRKK